MGNGSYIRTQLADCLSTVGTVTTQLRFLFLPFLPRHPTTALSALYVSSARFSAYWASIPSWFLLIYIFSCESLCPLPHSVSASTPTTKPLIPHISREHLFGPINHCILVLMQLLNQAYHRTMGSLTGPIFND